MYFLPGTPATSDVDYVNGTFSRVSVNADQDIATVCQSIQINNDDVIERTEYFTVSLRRSLRRSEIATCQVAIVDRNGGKHRVLVSCVPSHPPYLLALAFQYYTVINFL